MKKISQLFAAALFSFAGCASATPSEEETPNNIQRIEHTAELSLDELRSLGSVTKALQFFKTFENEAEEKEGENKANPQTIFNIKNLLHSHIHPVSDLETLKDFSRVSKKQLEYVNNEMKRRLGLDDSQAIRFSQEVNFGSKSFYRILNRLSCKLPSNIYDLDEEAQKKLGKNIREEGYEQIVSFLGGNPDEGFLPLWDAFIRRGNYNTLILPLRSSFYTTDT
ncbi:MAG: hypothetical protein GY915_04420, partial [bacterium]|nr:hypothetical protein [bacterium]